MKGVHTREMLNTWARIAVDTSSDLERRLAVANLRQAAIAALEMAGLYFEQLELMRREFGEDEEAGRAFELIQGGAEK